MDHKCLSDIFEGALSEAFTILPKSCWRQEPTRIGITPRSPLIAYANNEGVSLLFEPFAANANRESIRSALGYTFALLATGRFGSCGKVHNGLDVNSEFMLLALGLGYDPDQCINRPSDQHLSLYVRH